MSRYLQYGQIFWALTCRDFKAFSKRLGNKVIDTIILFSTSIIVFAYFMPLLGLAADFGLMIFASCFVIFSFFDSIGFATLLVMDIEGDRAIVHSVSVPMPANLTLAQPAISWALRTGVMTLIGFLVGKALLGSQLVLGSIAYGKFLFAYSSIYLMFGFFGLWLASLIRHLNNMAGLFVRVANPMFMFGAYMFTWTTAYKLAPVIGILLLLNPMVYANEALRTTVLGQEGFLSFGLCVGMMWLFIIGFAWDGVRRLKKRLELP